MRLLNSEDFGWPRDYLCPHFNSSWEDCDREYRDAEGLSLQVRRFLSELRTPFRHEGRWGLSRALLIPGAMVRYWTGHSGRHTLPSLSAAIEVGKEKRDFLGRWAYSQHGSQDYVLTARQVVHGVQNHVCKTLLEGSDSGGYVEEETLSELEAFARANNMDLDFLEGHRILKWDSDAKSWKLGGVFPACAGVLRSDAEALGDLDAKVKEPFSVLEPDKVEGDFPYFVTVSRSGFRRLHLSGACAVRQEKCLETIGLNAITDGCADAICKLCRPKVDAAESSSSGSEAAEAS